MILQLLRYFIMVSFKALFLRQNALLPKPFPLLIRPLKIFTSDALQLPCRFCLDLSSVVTEAPSCNLGIERSYKGLNRLNKMGVLSQWWNFGSKLMPNELHINGSIVVIKNPPATLCQTSEASQNFSVVISVHCLVERWQIPGEDCTNNQRKQSMLDLDFCDFLVLGSPAIFHSLLCDLSSTSSSQNQDSSPMMTRLRKCPLFLWFQTISTASYPLCFCQNFVNDDFGDW